MNELLQNFHFLRPEWLLALLLCPLASRFQGKSQRLGHDWARAIDPKLLAFLTPQHDRPDNRRTSSKPLKPILPWVLALCVLALSGPSWEQKPQPVMQLQDQMVVIVDLSLSMLATDLAPNRLTRAKQKLQDLLNLRKEGNTALIVFSGDAHVVTPLTDDANTISANIPALDPYLMPVIGARPDRAIEEAIKLFEQAGSRQGRIILLTDGVEPVQAERIADALKGKNFALHLLVAGTPGGGPVQLKDGQFLKDGDSVVIPKTDFDLLGTVATDNGGIMRPLALDDSDLSALDISAQVLKSQFNQSALETRAERFDVWEDKGYLLLALIVPLLLLARRQGALLILLLVILPNDRAAAFSWTDLWQTRDQQAQQKLEEDPKGAAELFESPEHKAFAQARASDYDNAAKNFSQINSADAKYNEGNALAHAGKLKEAITAYEKALELAPEMQNARDNKTIVEDLLKQQEQQQKEQKGQEGQEGQEDQQQQSGQDSQQKDQKNSQQQDSEQKGGERQDSGQQGSEQQNEQASETKDAGHQSQSDKEKSDQEKADQAQQNVDKQEKKTDEQNKEQGEEKSVTQGEKGDKSDDAPEGEGAQAMAEELSSEEQQSFEQWMRRVPDDPGGLLREKFKHQSKERNQIEKKEGEPLW